MKPIFKIIAAAVASAIAAALTQKAIDSKQTTKEVEKAISEISKTWEAKYTMQAIEFTKQSEMWELERESLKNEKEKKNQLMQDCLKYIDDLEHERDVLAEENETLTSEKQELLEKLYGIRTKLSML